MSTVPHVEVVGRASSGREALDQVVRLHPDLVLVDLAMPDMNGFETTQRIKAQADAPRVVILTMHDSPDYRRAAQAAGADNFMFKGDLSSEFIPLIHEFYA